jgi:hypothetical protein
MEPPTPPQASAGSVAGNPKFTFKPAYVHLWFANGHLGPDKLFPTPTGLDVRRSS